MVSVEGEGRDERRRKERIPVTSSTVLQLLLLLSYRYNRQETALPLQSTLHDNNI